MSVAVWPSRSFLVARYICVILPRPSPFFLGHLFPQPDAHRIHRGPRAKLSYLSDHSLRDESTHSIEIAQLWRTQTARRRSITATIAPSLFLTHAHILREKERDLYPNSKSSCRTICDSCAYSIGQGCQIAFCSASPPLWIEWAIKGRFYSVLHMERKRELITEAGEKTESSCSLFPFLLLIWHWYCRSVSLEPSRFNTRRCKLQEEMMHSTALSWWWRGCWWSGDQGVATNSFPDIPYIRIYVYVAGGCIAHYRCCWACLPLSLAQFGSEFTWTRISITTYTNPHQSSWIDRVVTTHLLLRLHLAVCWCALPVVATWGDGWEKPLTPLFLFLLSLSLLWVNIIIFVKMQCNRTEQNRTRLVSLHVRSARGKSKSILEQSPCESKR